MAVQQSSHLRRSCTLPASAAAVFAGVVMCIALCSAPVVNAAKEADTPEAITLTDVSVYAFNVTQNVAIFMHEKKESSGYQIAQNPLWFYALIPPGASDSDPKCDYPGRLKKFFQGATELSMFAEAGVLQLVDEKTATGSQLEDQKTLFEESFQNMTIPSSEEMGCMGILAANVDWEFSDTYARVPVNVTDKETGETTLEMRIEKVRTNPEVYWAKESADAFDVEMMMDLLSARSIFRGPSLLTSTSDVENFIGSAHYNAASAVVAYMNYTRIAQEMEKVKSVNDAPLAIQTHVFTPAVMAALSNLPIFKFYYNFAIADAAVSPTPLSEDGSSIFVYRPVMTGKKQKEDGEEGELEDDTFVYFTPPEEISPPEQKIQTIQYATQSIFTNYTDIVNSGEMALRSMFANGAHMWLTALATQSPRIERERRLGLTVESQMLDDAMGYSANDELYNEWLMQESEEAMEKADAEDDTEEQDDDEDEEEKIPGWKLRFLKKQEAKAKKLAAEKSDEL